MSYGEKYFTNFYDNDNNKFRLQIFEWGFTDSASDNIQLADNPVVITYSQDDDYFQPIIGSNCKLRLFVEDNTGGDHWEDEQTHWDLADFFWERTGFDFLNPVNDREFKVVVNREILNGESDAYAVANRLKDDTADFTEKLNVGDLVVNTTTGDTTQVSQVSSATIIKLSDDIFDSAGGEGYEIYRNFWAGFIMQDSYTLPLTTTPFVVEIYASDLIGTINGYNLDLTTSSPQAFEVLRNCLKNINIQSGNGTSGRSLDFSYKFLCRLNQNSSSTWSSNDNIFVQTYISSFNALQDENGNYLNGKYVLDSLLRMFNCRIFQHEGTWTIIDNASLSLTTFDDDGGSYSKEFKTYDKDGSSTGTLAIETPISNINSTQDAGTIQPLNNDLIKIIRRPTIRQRTQIRIKDTLKSRFLNGNFENVSTATSPTPSWGEDIDDWTISDKSKAYAVDDSAFDTINLIEYGITPYSGTYSMITIGSSSGTTVLASNNTGAIGTTAEPIKLSFADYAYDPDNSGLLAYELRWRLEVSGGGGTSYYWNVNDNEWKTSAVQGINTITGSIQEQWRFNEISINPPPETGTATIEFFYPYETVYGNSAFRIYYDDIVLQNISDLEYYDTLTNIVKSDFIENSGVLSSNELRFGMLVDDKYSNNLVDSSGNDITAYRTYDETSGRNLESLMNTQRLNEFARNNFRYEGTFRKIADADGFTKNIDMLTLPKILFESLTQDDHQAIDNLQFNVAKNRYKISTHVPIQSNLTQLTDVESFTDFYRFKPED